MSKVYCFGESLVRFFPRDLDVPLRDVSSFRRYLAGDSARTAHSIAKLGGRAVYLGAVAKDSFGDYIRRTLRTAGVDISYLVRNPGADTPLLFAGSDFPQGEQKRYCENSPAGAVSAGHLETVAFERSDILYLDSSLFNPPHLLDCIQLLVKQAVQERSLISLDLCFPPAKPEDRETLKHFALHLSGGLIITTTEALSCLLACSWEESCNRLIDWKNAVLLLGGPTGPSLHTANWRVTDGTFHMLGHWTQSKHAYLGGLFHALTVEGNRDFRNILATEHLAKSSMRYAGVTAALAATKPGGLLNDTSFEEVKNMLEKQQKNPQKELDAIKKLAREDYYRLAYHAMPECGWINDPNGLVEYKGEYHAFFQHYPYAPEWGPMHWGHVVSKDLLHWRHLPTALSPDHPYEKGCFSGSAVDNHGELTLIYTAHDDESSPKEKQCIATSSDGVHFRKYEGNPVIQPPKGLGDDFRDPKVNFVNGRWHMVVGSTRQGKGCVSMFASDDLRQWEYKGIICESNGEQGDMWECPDLFSLDGVDVLMFSPMNMKGAKTLFVTGNMDYDAYTFTQKNYYEVDHGRDFYAPQTLQTSDGRRILIGWMEMWGNDMPTQKSGWAGALTLPRELYLMDGIVCQRPVHEALQMRSKPLFSGAVSLKDGAEDSLESAQGDCLEINLKLDAASQKKGKLVLNLRVSADGQEKTTVVYDLANQKLTLDKTCSGQGDKVVNSVAAPCVGGVITLQIFVDKSSVEVFANGGRQVITGRIYPAPTSLGINVTASGANISLDRLELFSLS